MPQLAVDTGIDERIAKAIETCWRAKALKAPSDCGRRAATMPGSTPM